MADLNYVYWVAPECNAGTAASAYTTTDVGISTVLLHCMEVRIPPGPNGLTGIALVDSGAFIIPHSDAVPSWIVGNNDLLRYEYEKELGKNVALATYNTGSYNHTWQVRLIYTPMSAVAASEPSIEVITPLTIAKGG